MARQVQEPVLRPTRAAAACATGTTSCATASSKHDGIVGEVIFPNTVPPFFPSFVLFARPPKDRRVRAAAAPASTPTTDGWPTGATAIPNGAPASGRSSSTTSTTRSRTCAWIKENGLRGGVLISAIAPDIDWVKPLYDPYYDPLWKVCEDLDVPVNSHGGTGLPDYGKYPVANLLYIAEAQFYSQRPFVQLLLSGVFERFPKLKFVMTEMGCAWLPPMLAALRLRSSSRSTRRARPASCVTPRSTGCRGSRASTSRRTATSV